MKKLLIIAMVTVFALSFVAGITAAKNKPGTGGFFLDLINKGPRTIDTTGSAKQDSQLGLHHHVGFFLLRMPLENPAPT